MEMFSLQGRVMLTVLLVVAASHPGKNLCILFHILILFNRLIIVRYTHFLIFTYMTKYIAKLQSRLL